MKDFGEMLGRYGKTAIPFSETVTGYDSPVDKVLEEKSNKVFLVGFPKAATSSISAALYQHPDICFPIKKEPFYFWTDEYELGNKFYLNKYFPHYNGEKIIVDAATMNSYLPYVPERIKADFPDAKIVMSFRNPIDRAYSNWWMYRSSGEEDLSFEDAIRWELKEIEKGLIDIEDNDFWKWYSRRLVTADFSIRRRTVRTYLTRGFYYPHVKRYLEKFDSSNVAFVFQEDMRTQKRVEIEKIIKFIGADVKYLDQCMESRDFHRNLNSIKLTDAKASLRPVKKYVPKAIVNLTKSLIHYTDTLMGKSKIDSKLRVELLDFYRDKNDAFGHLIDKDLSFWNN
jgi:hypothetical protein